MPKPIVTPDMPVDLPAPTGLELPVDLPGEEAPDPKQRAAERLATVQGELLILSAELTTAEDKDTPRISRAVQKLRVSMLILNEIVTGISDPTTYRELTLLNKLTTGRDLEDDAANELAREAEEAAMARLEAQNIDPSKASSMVRVLDALQSIMKREATDAEQRRQDG